MTLSRAADRPAWLLATLAGLCLCASAARADDAAPAAATSDKPDPIWAVHGQMTFTDQVALPYHSPYVGPNSLTPGAGRETGDITLYAGLRLWRGAEIWINPEMDQGFGLNDTLGAAGFTSGEAYKVGKASPYFRVQRLFVRQTIDLGGESQAVEADLNQMAGRQTANRLVFTVGKMSVPDIFDANRYAHDPRNDFLNWALIDTGSFDYAADAWGYSYGAAAEWYQGAWTLRGGLYDLSDVPNSERLDHDFGQMQGILELERRYQLGGHDGKLAISGFLSRGRFARFDDAIALADATGTTPDVSKVRRYRSRSGIALNLEQELAPGLGLFVRAGTAGGGVEPDEFTDIDSTAAAGLSLSGARWGRKDDTIGLAGVVNGISKIHQIYLADGGLGILVGDGRLPHPTTEKIVETYYSYSVNRIVTVDFDAQLIVDPAYNADRGPAPVLAIRLHAKL